MQVVRDSSLVDDFLTAQLTTVLPLCRVTMQRGAVFLLLQLLMFVNCSEILNLAIELLTFSLEFGDRTCDD